MTEPTDTTDDDGTANESPEGPESIETTVGEPGSADARSGTDEMSVLEQLQWGALVLLVVAAIWTTAQFYLSATRAIEVWVGQGYQPVVVAAFNLALLLAAVAGIARLARRLGSLPA